MTYDDLLSCRKCGLQVTSVRRGYCTRCYDAVEATLQSWAELRAEDTEHHYSFAQLLQMENDNRLEDQRTEPPAVPLGPPDDGRVSSAQECSWTNPYQGDKP